MQKTKNYQLDIFGNEIPLSRVNLIKKCNERYVKKELSFKKNYIKNGGVLNVNKALFKSD